MKIKLRSIYLQLIEILADLIGRREMDWINIYECNWFDYNIFFFLLWIVKNSNAQQIQLNSVLIF